MTRQECQEAVLGMTGGCLGHFASNTAGRVDDLIATVPVIIDMILSPQERPSVRSKCLQLQVTVVGAHQSLGSLISLTGRS